MSGAVPHPTRARAEAARPRYRAGMRILTGTSGWSYPAWKGPFYPAKLPTTRMLSAYAERLPTVEVNNTFHRMPRGELLAGWRAQVPASFVFSLKAPQLITHWQRLSSVEGIVAAFYRAAAELGPTLGPVLFQLPPSLHKDLPLLRAFLALLPHGGRAAVEFRHPSWDAPEVHQALADAGAALVCADTEESAGNLVATAPHGYLRLRRPDYDVAAIVEWAARIAGQPWQEAFVFFKHEDEARGPAFALALAEAARRTAASETPATSAP